MILNAFQSYTESFTPQMRFTAHPDESIRKHA